jgi:hypothetical protein
MRRREHRPAILLPVLMCLALGLVCAYASSIVAVLIPDRGQHAPRTSSRHDLPGDTTVYISVVRRPGYSLMTVTGPMPTHVADELDRFRSQEISLVPGDPRPYWLRWGERNEPQISRGVAAGWPLLCVWGRTDKNVNHDPQERHTGLSYVTIDRTTRAQRAFPWMPLWLGVAGNAVLYGGLLLVLWFALVWLLRRWRRHRGRCPNCAYPMQQGVGRCPECGLPPQRAAAGSSSLSAKSSTSSRHTTSTLTSNNSSNDDR